MANSQYSYRRNYPMRGALNRRKKRQLEQDWIIEVYAQVWLFEPAVDLPNNVPGHWEHIWSRYSGMRDKKSGMRPLTLTACIYKLRKINKNYNAVIPGHRYVYGDQYQVRLRNLKTEEVIPGEALLA